MKPYIEYHEPANNNSILHHAVFLEAVEDVSISTDCILLNYRDEDINTGNITATHIAQHNFTHTHKQKNHKYR